MAKIEAGRVTLQEHDFDLHQLLDDLGEIFRLRAQAKHLQLLITHDPATPRFVCADESKLRQVLINLLGNALKFTIVGRVTLSVEVAGVTAAGVTAAGCRLAFVVQDTGPGIQPDVMAAIFEPFVQGKGDAQVEGGTGLGLPISRQFARLMGGDLTVASAGVAGQGSCFTLEAPVRVVTEPNQRSAPHGAQPRAIGLAPGQPLYRLLVADDRAESRKLLADLLTQLGFAVRTAGNGAEALQVWEEWAPQLIWMDMRMPVMDGHEATRRIKATPQGQTTVVVALTASVFIEQRASVLADGCDDFMGKPFRQEEIVACLVRDLGVQMLYADPAPARSSAPEPTPVLAANSLSAQWIAQMCAAVMAADTVSIQNLIAQIDAEFPAFANILYDRLNDFDYPTLLDLLTHSQEI
jgi:CheY-like chemotaxis protein